MTREEAIGRLSDMANEIRDYCDYTKHMTEEAKDELEAFNMAIKALEERPKGEWIPVSEKLPEEFICDDGYIEPSDYVLVWGDYGNYGVSRYWGNRRTKIINPNSFKDWVDLDWICQKPIAWMPLPKPYKAEMEVEE